jgi:integrase/recombinase XerD
LVESPADFLEPPKTGRKLPVVLSEEEIDAMISAVDRSTAEGERNVAMLETLYSCGLRVSELVGLRMTQVHATEGFVQVVGKGNKERLVPVGGRALKHIRMYVDQVRVHLNIQPGARDIVFLSKRILSDIVLRRIWWKQELIYVRFRKCWGMRVSLLRRFIRI